MTPAQQIETLKAAAEQAITEIINTFEKESGVFVQIVQLVDFSHGATRSSPKQRLDIHLVCGFPLTERIITKFRV